MCSTSSHLLHLSWLFEVERFTHDELMHLQELCTSLSTPARDSGG